ncbi:thioesterase family protein [Staphylococcus sp. ACRSN]|uniref:thioesterase family protein n=1 Tax=Staphylococcus sp. ACRSN TaxID=2918214 RepID=UPI001EF18880|nr:thioesterase family protein [Staphylococcus sp. ACRSN]MCG7338189.1 thioesterase family protein [Staphylococcus sp. ACRSN]
MNIPFTFKSTVSVEMIDHNGHVHDANYNIVFSEAINQFNYQYGLPLEMRAQLGYTLFTVEEHTSYLSELHEGEAFNIAIYIYNYDAKRIHFFSIMTNSKGTTVATNEALMIGIDKHTKKTAPFPDNYANQIKYIYQRQPNITWPKQLGHRIDIPN